MCVYFLFGFSEDEGNRTTTVQRISILNQNIIRIGFGDFENILLVFLILFLQYLGIIWNIFEFDVLFLLPTTSELGTQLLQLVMILIIDILPILPILLDWLISFSGDRLTNDEFLSFQFRLE